MELEFVPCESMSFHVTSRAVTWNYMELHGTAWSSMEFLAKAGNPSEFLDV